VCRCDLEHELILFQLEFVNNDDDDGTGEEEEWSAAAADDKVKMIICRVSAF